MKRFTLYVLALILAFPGMIQEAKGQTKVFDQTITWTHPPYQYGGYGFYWWHRTDGHSIINYGNMPSSNWLSPTDYYNGNFTLSVEVISQPTSEPFYIQFGIWGDKHKGSLHTETVAARQWVSGGAGASGSWSLGSPSGWWNKQPSDRVDFSRANDFYRIGVVLWDGASTCIPMGTDWSSSGCPETAYKYFPMTIKISVYASGGSGPPPPPPPPPVSAPNYSIDYWGERTDKVVSSDDQYSYNSNFSSVVDGNGQHLYLSPGTTVYFRKKSDHSKTQTLSVPYRPGAPTFGIDYANERTSATVSSEYTYSYQSNMSSSSDGNGSHVGLSPGSNMYFRKKATGSNFASSIQTLEVPYRPGAPGFAIDYFNERTSGTVSSEFRYSSNSDMSSSTDGTGSHVSLTPGSNTYFRKKSAGSNFASAVQTLTVPGRPAEPSFGIDYINERSSAEIGADIQYSLNSDMSASSAGDGSFVSLTPGTNIYFRKPASASAFRSGIQTLTVPGRPEAPSFAIDFMKEEISMPIGTDYAYGLTPDLSDASQGSDNMLKVSPGENIYIQGLASSSAFASEIQALISPERTGAPSMGIDYENESTDMVLSSAYEYSESASFEVAETGTGTSLSLTPGSARYFRMAASATAYSSEVFHLPVPERPVVSSTETGSTTLFPFMVDISFAQEIASLNATAITVQNGEMQNLSLKNSGIMETVFEGEVYASANEIISILIPADATAEGNFVSNTLEISFTGQLPGVGINTMDLNSFNVYPNPGKGVFHVTIDDFNALSRYRIEVSSISGQMVHNEEFYGTEAEKRMDLSALSEGLYMLRLIENDQIRGVGKLIIR